MITLWLVAASVTVSPPNKASVRVLPFASVAPGVRSSAKSAV